LGVAEEIVLGEAEGLVGVGTARVEVVDLPGSYPAGNGANVTVLALYGRIAPFVLLVSCVENLNGHGCQDFVRIGEGLCTDVKPRKEMTW